MADSQAYEVFPTPCAFANTAHCSQCNLESRAFCTMRSGDWGEM